MAPRGHHELHPGRCFWQARQVKRRTGSDPSNGTAAKSRTGQTTSAPVNRHTAALPAAFDNCTSFSDCANILVKAGYRQQITYQPVGNFWALRWAETGIYLGLAAGLAAFCTWWSRRRLT